MRWAFEVGLEVAFTKLTKTSLGNVDETLYCRSCESGSSSGHERLDTRSISASLSKRAMSPPQLGAVLFQISHKGMSSEAENWAKRLTLPGSILCKQVGGTMSTPHEVRSAR